MNIFAKSMAALLIAGTAVAAMPVPAQAQYYRDGWRGDRNDRWDRDRRRHYREHRREWRRHNDYGWRGHYRQRCWTEWRYSRYYHERVRVRICR